MSNTSRRNTIVPVTAIILLLVAGLYLSGLTSSPELVSPDMSDEIGTQEELPTGERPTSTATPPAGDPVAIEPTTALDEGSDSDNAGKVKVVFQFKDHSGAEWSFPQGIELEIEAMAGAPPETQTYTSNEPGIVVVYVPKYQSVFIECRMLADGWLFVENGRLEEAKAKYRIKLNTTDGKPHEIELIVGKTATTTLSFRYEDGTPYTGYGVTRDESRSFYEKTWVEDGECTIFSPADVEYTIWAESRRLLYKNVEKTITITVETKNIELVLLRVDKEKIAGSGRISVVVANPTDKKVDIDIVRVRSPRDYRWSGTNTDNVRDWNSDYDYMSPRMTIGTYKVVARTARVRPTLPPKPIINLAATGSCEVLSGQVVTLHLNLAETGSVTVKVVGSDGQPIEGAVVSTNDVSTAGDKMIKELRRRYALTKVYALTDADGNATLGNIPAGERTITCVAIGFDAVARPVFVHANSTTELGIVVLQQSLGSIRILIDNPEAVDPDLEQYEVMLLHFHKGILRSAERFTGKEFTISRAKYDTYTVSIKHVTGSLGAWSQNVTVSEENPVGEVVMKMMDREGLRKAKEKELEAARERRKKKTQATPDDK